MDKRLTTCIIEPFFYGSTRRLYGCCHQPPPGARRRGVVVLCQTIAQEYICCHRAFFQLAERLANAGFTTLRFDYYGCGDSEGDFEDGAIPTWVDDIDSSIEEMKTRTGVEKVTLVGYRFGASLALMAAMRSAAVENLVLWDTVTHGGEFMRQYQVIQADMDNTGKSNALPDREDSAVELAGFPFAQHLFREIETMHLHDRRIPTVSNSLTVINQEERPADCSPLHAGPEGEGAHTVRTVVDHQLWRHQLYKRLIPAHTLDTIVSWIEGVSP